MSNKSAEPSKVSADSAELFHLIVDNVKDYAIFMTDVRGIIVSWNPGVQSLLGYSEDEIIGQPLAIIFTPPDVMAGIPAVELKTAAREGRAEDKRWHQRKDGTRFWANGMVVPLRNDDGTLRGFAKIMRNDTAQKLAEDNLEQSNRRIENILESIGDAFYALDHDWRFTYLNQKSEALLGRSSEELVGKMLWNEFPEALESDLHTQYRKAVADQTTISFEIFYKPSATWYEVRAYPSLDGLSVYFHDSTERKQIETTLREAGERYRALIDATATTVWHATPAGSLTFVGSNWTNVSGQKESEILDDGWLDAVHPDDRAPTIEAWKTALENESHYTAEFRILKTDGAYNWYAANAVPLRNEDGSVREWVGLNVDIDAKRQIEIDRRQALEDRERLLLSEREARMMADNANQLKDEFLATLSHELRTPLNAILGWSQLLQRKNIGEAEKEKALTIIERSARSQSQLIDDVLDVSRIITGKLRLDVQPIDLMSVIEAAIDAARPAFEAKNINLKTVIDSMAGQVSGDPDRLQQVVWNLLSNAIKFTPKEGSIQLRLERLGSQVEIVVSDSGKGIDPAFLPYVFDRFRQSDGSMTRRQGGLGLGLSIVRQLVELHGGSVSVDSRGENQGATFTVSLPVLPMRRDVFGSTPRAYPTSRAGALDDVVLELTGLRILLVDDEADSRDLLNLVLGSCGAEIVAAESAADALRAFETGRFDMIISDIGMPNEDGFSLIKKIRKLPNGSGGAPAIALTAYARSEDRLKALKSGFQMHMAKPVEPAELIMAVGKLTGRSGN